MQEPVPENQPLTREAWRRVKTIAAAAWSCAPDERAAFVAREAAGDELLSREVSSLLEAMEGVGERFEAPAVAATALRALAPERSILAGTRVGAWEIVRELGNGGMGTVYLVERT